MRIAGFGFRAAASIASLEEALAAAGGPAGLCALAALEDRADAPAFRAFAGKLGLPVRIVRRAALAGVETPTRSPRIAARFGTGSVAEAVALAAAGADAGLFVPRMTSRDRMATVAIAGRSEA